jgi:hypothetical protein
MIDYRAHIAALAHFRQALAQSNFPDPGTAALRDQQLKDVEQAPGMAMLGSLLDHLLWHASSDGTEIDLVERAADLWQQGLQLYETLGEFRTSLETALADPADPSAVAAVNAAATKMHPLLLHVKSKSREIRALRQEARKFAHLPPHPRQDGKRLAEWTWGDIFLARRTDAFVREANRHASDVASRAFAFGVLSGYGANACGSAYLGQVVGGPRRAHRHRDRVARNTVGSWFARNQPGLPSLTAIADQITQDAPTLPQGIVDLIAAAFNTTYNMGLTPPVPDLQLGYWRLIRHLELLDTFVLPAAPSAPREPFASQLYGDPANPHEPAVPQLVGVPEAQGGGGGGGGGGIVPLNQAHPDALTNADAPDSTEVECGAFWEAVGLGLLFILGGWFFCVINWVSGNRCSLTDDIGDGFSDAFPDGAYVGPEHESDFPQALTATDLSNAALVDQVTKIIGHLFDLQTLLWEALHKAYDFLALHGLIYPNERLGRPRYRQFVRIPALPGGNWPKRPEPDPNQLCFYPSTPTEQPFSDLPGYGYAPQASPGAFVNPAPGQTTPTATDISSAVWRQLATGSLDADNYDLDADRGLRHPCWTTGGSINDIPLTVIFLAYAQT